MSYVLRHCANCEYWHLYNEEEFEKLGIMAEGECHRYPPNIPIFNNNPNTAYYIKDLSLCLTKDTILVNHPFTFAEDWCGEFKCIDSQRWFEEDEE